MKKAAETTNTRTRDYRTYTPVSNSERPFEVFNRLSHHPAEPIDLGDGRILDVVEWDVSTGDIVDGNRPGAAEGMVQVNIKGNIRDKD